MFVKFRQFLAIALAVGLLIPPSVIQAASATAEMAASPESQIIQPAITLNPSSGPPGTQVTASWPGTSGACILIYAGPARAYWDGVQFVGQSADRSSVCSPFVITLSVPADATAGQHTIRFTGTGSSLNATFAVTGGTPPPGGATDIVINVDRGPGSIYYIGERITTCVTPTFPAPNTGNRYTVRLTDTVSGYSPVVLFEGRLPSGVQRCFSSVISSPVGTETMTAELRDNMVASPSGVVARSSVTFLSTDRGGSTPVVVGLDLAVDRGAGATYYVGEAVTSCLTTTRRTNVRWWAISPDGQTRTLDEGPQEGRACLSFPAGPQLGQWTLRADAQELGRVIATDQTSFVTAQRASLPPPPPQAPSLPPPSAPPAPSSGAFYPSLPLQPTPRVPCIPGPTVSCPGQPPQALAPPTSSLGQVVANGGGWILPFVDVSDPANAWVGVVNPHPAWLRLSVNANGAAYQDVTPWGPSGYLGGTAGAVWQASFLSPCARFQVIAEPSDIALASAFLSFVFQGAEYQSSDPIGLVTVGLEQVGSMDHLTAALDALQSFDVDGFAAELDLSMEEESEAWESLADLYGADYESLVVDPLDLAPFLLQVVSFQQQYGAQTVVEFTVQP